MAATAQAGVDIPTRPLGHTGVRTPILGIGCGMSWWDAFKTEDRALEALELAADLGITYFDTGQGYGKGLSETWIGKVLKHRRKEVFIATKITVRDGDEALRETDRCLKRLQTDQIDLLHIHNLAGRDDLARIEVTGGLVDIVHKLRDQKVTRFIGITSHTDPEVLKTALERHDFDCTQMALNAALQGFAGDRPSTPGNSFESTALPAATKKGIGAIAMKVTGRNTLLGSQPNKSGIQDLLRYALTLPISLAVVGMSTLENIRQNAELARNFKPMSEPERNRLSGRMAAANKTALDRRFRHHQDA
ncbi:MAG: aldo/keto reductase [bacterium]|nr:aldo/keto reductase [bacterium]